MSQAQKMIRDDKEEDEEEEKEPFVPSSERALVNSILTEFRSKEDLYTYLTINYKSNASMIFIIHFV